MVGERFEASGATTTSATASGLHGRALPPSGLQETPGGGTASSDIGTGAPSTGGGVEATLRRSARGWKPSTECLTNIAQVTMDLEDMEREMGQEEGEVQPERVGGARELSSETTLEHAHWLRECSFASQGEELCPRSHGDAMMSTHARKVRDAELDEFNSHVVNGTFGPPLQERDFAPGPPLKAVWVFSRSKKDAGGFKARVVMQGFLMKQGWHFNDVHASVPAVVSYRAFMIGVAHQRRILEHWDVKTAFLTTKMDCDVDVTLPEAFNHDKALQHDARRGTARHRVLKVIPGCPQGSRLWHDNLFSFLFKQGFAAVAPQEECLLIERGNPNGIHLLIWTDDICVSYPPEHKHRVRQLFSTMLKQFPNGIHVGEEREGALTVLGTVVVRVGPKTLFIHQKPFTDKLIDKSGFSSGPERGVAIPVSPSFVFTTKDSGEKGQEGEGSTWYRSVLMSVSYLANWTRPDVAYAVSKLARFMQTPGARHITELKRVLRYLRCNRDLGLTYDFSQGTPRQGLYGYFDASFADCVDTRRSTVAHVFFFKGAVVSWKTRLYSFVTTSTNHSELVASAMAAREAKFLLLLFTALGLCEQASSANPGTSAGATVDLFTDSMGVVAIARSSALSSATRHIEVADFYVRELVKRNIVTVSHVPSGDMLADVLTKALPSPKFGAMVSHMVSRL